MRELFPTEMLFFPTQLYFAPKQNVSLNKITCFGGRDFNLDWVLNEAWFDDDNNDLMIYFRVGRYKYTSWLPKKTRIPYYI